jgi:hypothetical protein
VIDLDESSNYNKLETKMNRKLGKVIQERRCNTRGKYKKGEESIS